MTTIEQYARRLETADARIRAEDAVALRRALDDLRGYAQRIARRRTGAMADSMTAFGPFAIGDGSLEGTIESGAFYADYVVQTSADADFATRTIEEQGARLQQLADEIAGHVVAIIEGRA